MVNQYEHMTVQDIEGIGADIQSDISESMTGMLKQAKLIDLDSAGSKLQELSEVADSATRKGKLSNLPIFRSPKRWLSRYESVESKLTSIGESIDAEQEKLQGVLNSLMESKDFLREKSDELCECGVELQGYIDWLKANPDADEDGLKMQAAVNRLKVISTTEAVVKQEIVKSVLVIQENKEIQQQLNEAATNLIPMFNVMLMNTLASKANLEAVKIRKAMIKTANRLVVENAKQIEKTADELLTGRQESLISPQSIMEANKILQDTVKKVLDSSKSETAQNMALIESLKASSNSLSSMSLLAEGAIESIKIGSSQEDIVA